MEAVVRSRRLQVIFHRCIRLIEGRIPETEHIPTEQLGKPNPHCEEQSSYWERFPLRRFPRRYDENRWFSENSRICHEFFYGQRGPITERTRHPFEACARILGLGIQD